MKNRAYITSIIGSLLAWYSLGASALDNQQIQVTASVAFKAPYLEMVQDFEKQTGLKVNTNWLPTVEIVELIKKGEAGDLVILSATNIDDLSKNGYLIAGSRID